MGIFSRFFGRAYDETVQVSPDRANVRFILPEDTALWVAPAHRAVIRQRFEWIRQNFGLMQEMVAGIARQAVGKGISIQLNTEDTEWNAEAERQFEQWALTPDRCDASGRRDFYESQKFAVESFIGPGEFFCRDVINPREVWKGEPAFQIYDPSEIGTPKDSEDESILDGIRVDDTYNATEIYYRNKAGDFVPSDAAEWCHWFKPTTTNQVRGVSPFAPALNRFVGIYELERLTIRSAKAHQLIALVLKGFNKGQQKGAFGTIGTNGGALDTTQDSAAAEKLFQGAGGAIAYVGAEGDAKLLSSTQPSPLISQFFSDQLIRDISLAPGMPMEWFWKMDALGGPGQRAILAKVDAVVTEIADKLIHRWIKRQAFRVLQWRITTGALSKPKNNRWFETFSFQTPPRTSIDNGRDTNATLAQLAAGTITMRDIADAAGKNYRDQDDQWIREVMEHRNRLVKHGASEAMLARFDANAPLWRAAAPGAAMPTPDEPVATPPPKAPEPATPAPALTSAGW